jgi:integrase
MSKKGQDTNRPFLQLRNNTYYARLTLPKDVRDDFGKTELWQSLKTKNPRQAELKAIQLVAMWKEQIEQVRGSSSLLAEAATWRKQIQELKSLGAGDRLQDTQLAYSERIDDIVKERGESEALLFAEVAQGKKLPTKHYLEEWQKTRQVIVRTHQQETTRIETLHERFPTLPIKRKEVVRWIHDLQAEGKAEETIKGLIGTCRRYYSYLEEIEAIGEQHPNPFANHKYEKKKKASKQDERQAYEPEEVPRIVQAALEKHRKRGDLNLYAAILIGAYTGARREEIARLKVSDVRERSGVRYFAIEEAKSKAGLRDIPIHSKLLALVDHLVAHSQDGYLLSGEPITSYNDRADALGKRYHTLKKNLGYDHRYVFHSFRKTLATVLERKGFNHNQIAEIFGHEKLGITFGTYSAGLDLETKRQVVEQVDYPGLTVEGL